MTFLLVELAARLPNEKLAPHSHLLFAKCAKYPSCGWFERDETSVVVLHAGRRAPSSAATDEGRKPVCTKLGAPKRYRRPLARQA